MQFKSTTELRKYLVAQRKFRKLCLVQSEDFPDAKAGTLSRIIHDPAYEPMHQKVRDGLFLVDACPRCHRKARRPRPAPLPGSPCRGCVLLKEFRAKKKG